MSFDEYKAKVLRDRNELKFCPICSQRISDRTISLYKGLINSLYDVYCF